MWIHIPDSHVPTFLQDALLWVVCSNQDLNTVHVWHLVVTSLRSPVFRNSTGGRALEAFPGQKIDQKTEGPGKRIKSVET